MMPVREEVGWGLQPLGRRGARLPARWTAPPAGAAHHPLEHRAPSEKQHCPVAALPRAPSLVHTLGLNAGCSQPLLPLLPSPEVEVACRWRHCIHCCAPFACDPRPSVACIQSPLFEIPSVTSFNNWTLTRTWLFRKNIPEVFLESVIFMCKVTTGWVLIKGTRSSNSLTFPSFFFKGPHTSTGHTGTCTAHVPSRM